MVAILKLSRAHRKAFMAIPLLLASCGRQSVVHAPNAGASIPSISSQPNSETVPPGRPTGSTADSTSCAESAVSGRARSIANIDVTGSATVQDQSLPLQIGDQKLNLDAISAELGGRVPGAAFVLDGGDDAPQVLTVGVAASGVLDIDGVLVTQTGDTSTYKQIPLAGRGALTPEGAILITGGPTSELVALSTDRGVTWTFPVKFPLPAVAVDVDFSWWTYGRASLSTDGGFWLPAVLNTTPKDRSTIARLVYVMHVAADGSVSRITPLKRAATLDTNLLVAAGLDGQAWVVSDAGAVEYFGSDGLLLNSTKVAGAALDIAVRGSFAVALLGVGEQDDPAALAEVITCSAMP